MTRRHGRADQVVDQPPTANSIRSPSVPTASVQVTDSSSASRGVPRTSPRPWARRRGARPGPPGRTPHEGGALEIGEHTSELPSRFELVHRLRIEKKPQRIIHASRVQGTRPLVSTTN